MEQLFAAISSPEHELQFESYLDQWQQYYMTYQQNCQNSCDPTTFLQYTAQFQSYFTYLNHYRRLLAQRRAARTGVPPSPAEPPPPPPLPPASSAGVKPTSTTFSQNTTFSTKAEAIQGEVIPETDIATTGLTMTNSIETKPYCFCSVQYQWRRVRSTLTRTPRRP